MTASRTSWRWVSSERQYADGLTKISARQLLADRLRVGKIKLVFDDNFQAAKRKDPITRRESERTNAKAKSKATSKGLQAVVFSALPAAASGALLDNLFQPAGSPLALQVVADPAHYYLLLVFFTTMVVLMVNCLLLGRWLARPAAQPSVQPAAAQGRLLCDVGVQGPVHYDRSQPRPRYVAHNQGFDRAWEVSRENVRLR